MRTKGPESIDSHPAPTTRRPHRRRVLHQCGNSCWSRTRCPPKIGTWSHRSARTTSRCSRLHRAMRPMTGLEHRRIRVGTRSCCKALYRLPVQTAWVAKAAGCRRRCPRTPDESEDDARCCLWTQNSRRSWLRTVFPPPQGVPSWRGFRSRCWIEPNWSNRNQRSHLAESGSRSSGSLPWPSRWGHRST